MPEATKKSCSSIMHQCNDHVDDFMNTSRSVINPNAWHAKTRRRELAIDRKALGRGSSTGRKLKDGSVVPAYRSHAWPCTVWKSLVKYCCPRD